MELPPSSLDTNTCLIASARAEQYPNLPNLNAQLSRVQLLPCSLPNSVRTTSASLNSWNPKCTSCVPFPAQPSAIVISGFLPWGPLIHHKLPMKWILWILPSAEHIPAPQHTVNEYRRFISTSLPITHLSLTFVHLQFQTRYLTSSPTALSTWHRISNNRIQVCKALKAGNRGVRVNDFH